MLSAAGGTYAWTARKAKLAEQASTEQRLIDDVVALYELRILRLSDPELAAVFADSLQLSIPREELDGILTEVGLDPRRGNRFLLAVHDSLRARRSRFFPDQGSSNDGTGESARPATDASRR